MPRDRRYVRHPVAYGLHEDHTPSLHLYPDGTWACFGCRRGGTIYDFASHLWGIETKGRAFIELRERVAEEFEISPPIAR